MQNAWIDEHPRFDLAAITQRINTATEKFRTSRLPIIFVRHQDSIVTPGSEAWKVYHDLTQADTDYFINKTACDAFADTDLANLLKKMGSTRLVICGLATEFCVDTTIRAGLSQGYDVVALEDAHTTADRPHLDAKTIIQHHNWMWTNIAAPLGRVVQVTKTLDYLEAI